MSLLDPPNPRHPRPHRVVASRGGVGPVRLPAVLDRLAESWWRTGPRLRLLLGLAGAGTPVALALLLGPGPLDGPTVTVLVAGRDLRPGDEPTDGDLRRQVWPEALVPDQALTEPAGRLGAPLPRGAVLTRLHLMEETGRQLAPGRVGLAIPAALVPPLTVGTRVSVVGGDRDGGGRLLSRDALVTANDSEYVWVSIDPADAVAVSVAAGSGALAVLVQP